MNEREMFLLEQGKRVANGIEHENHHVLWPDHSFERADNGMPIPAFDVIADWRPRGYRQ